MASSAFRSTTRRTLHASSADHPNPPPCPRRSRSRSVSAGPRARGLLEDDYANTRTNPLFDPAEAEASPSPPPPPSGTAASAATTSYGIGGRGREPLNGAGRAGARARSASVAPQRRPRTASVNDAAAAGGRRVSRTRSVADDDARLYRGSETDGEARDVAAKLQSWRSNSSAQGSTTGRRCRQVDGTTHSDSSTAVSSPGHHLEHVIWQKNHSTVPVDPVLEIPPEFDPDSAEFISDISDYATEYRKQLVEIPSDGGDLVSDTRLLAANHHWEQIEIPLEFDPDAAELVSSIQHHGANKLSEQMGIPLEFDPYTLELAPDITEYTIKLKKSHERARKLRADLAVEEQREQELSRVLKDIVTVPNFTETNKKRARRKRSIERLKESRHLTEEAMNYFEEHVSISTMDSTDFSSPEDPQPNSVVTIQPKSNSRFFHQGSSSFQGPHTPTDQHGQHEESDKQTQCSISITGSDVSDCMVFSHTNPMGLEIRSNSVDDLDGFGTLQSSKSCFSFTHEPVKSVENCDIRQYIGNFGSRNKIEIRDMRSSYSSDDYVFQKRNTDLLTDMVMFQNRVQCGGLLICKIRTF